MSNNFEFSRNFKGVWIPKEIYLDRDLDATEKILYAEIDSLDKEEEGGCYASNEHLANFCMCSKSKVSSGISKLIEKGYIYVEKFDGRKRWLRVRKNKNQCESSGGKSADYQNNDCRLPENGMQKSFSCDSASRKNDERNNNISNIDINTLNNTDINAFTSIEEVKGDIYAFERKSTPQKQEKSAPKVPYIDARNFTWEELHEHIYARVTKMFQKHGVDDPEKLEELCKIIEYFYRKYDCGWKRYTILSDKALEGIVVKYLYPSYLLAENDVYSFAMYKKMIDKYFNTDFGKNDKNGYGTKVPVELSLPHFMDDAIRESMAMNSLDMTDCIKSVHVDYYE